MVKMPPVEVGIPVPPVDDGNPLDVKPMPEEVGDPFEVKPSLMLPPPVGVVSVPSPSLPGPRGMEPSSPPPIAVPAD